MSKLTNIIDCATEEAYQSAKSEYPDALFLTPDNTAAEIEAEVSAQINASCPFVLDRIIQPSDNNFWQMSDMDIYSSFSFEKGVVYLIVILQRAEVFYLMQNTNADKKNYTIGTVSYSLVDVYDSPPPVLCVSSSNAGISNTLYNSYTIKIYKAKSE